MKRKLLSALCTLALCISLLPSAAALSDEERRAADKLLTLGLIDVSAAPQLNAAVTHTQAASLCLLDPQLTALKSDPMLIDSPLSAFFNDMPFLNLDKRF